MKDVKRNPKGEGRGPKEGRRAKADSTETGVSATYWTEPLRKEDDLSQLKDDASAPKEAPQALGERTALFGEAIVGFAKKIPNSPVNRRLIEQVVGAGTSVGANFCEADDAVSGKEFKLRIGNCRKESKETMFFPRMMATAEPKLAEEARLLWREAKELNLIFGAIWRK